MRPSPLPRPLTPAGITARRPGFDRRLQGLQDYLPRSYNDTMLSFRKDEILYTDGKPTIIQTPLGPYKGVMAQNCNGHIGLVDPERTYPVWDGFFGFFSSAHPYLKYLD
ncbi:hypothetical protein BD410DRAFT_797699 [Rickenella mellea]|uniref:Uncharacterized protein n=1 Tax=Rickenella mellea TaxID=50990 RepID=A0A4Y7PF85_9AGAM|nr:hypothetical protein BD410DRAFT_797699 [Rickenella mellea]